MKQQVYSNRKGEGIQIEVYTNMIFIKITKRRKNTILRLILGNYKTNAFRMFIE